MKLDIHYFPQTDTPYIGNGSPASEGYDVADNLTAHINAKGDVVFVTLENAIEVLSQYLREYMAAKDQRATASILRDEGEPS